jgi:hypothetical protein
MAKPSVVIAMAGGGSARATEMMSRPTSPADRLVEISQLTVVITQPGGEEAMQR